MERNTQYLPNETNDVHLYCTDKHPTYVFAMPGRESSIPIAVTEEDMTMLSLQYSISDMSAMPYLERHFDFAIQLLNEHRLPKGYDYGTG